jgi:DNA-binding HxlR family transcriptional regulator
MSGTRYAQFCALARAAEILGERWTLLIIRELLLGRKRFSDLSDRLSGVSPTVLTARLNALIEQGVVQRATLPPPFNAQVYELTPVGLGLRPAVRELIRWGGHFIFPMRPDDEFDPDWGLLALDANARRTPTPPHKIVLRIRHKSRIASFLVEGGEAGTRVTRSDAQASSRAGDRGERGHRRGIVEDCADASALLRSKRAARLTGSRPEALPDQSAPTRTSATKARVRSRCSASRPSARASRATTASASARCSADTSRASLRFGTLVSLMAR